METTDNLNTISSLKEAFRSDYSKVTTAAELEQLEQRWLHKKKGELAGLLRGLGTLEDIEQRKQQGGLINDLKQEILVNIEQRKAELGGASKTNSHVQIDPTLPGLPVEPPHIHPIRQVQMDLVNLFTGLGFSVYEGNEVENELYCFEYLNIPDTHPARDLQDTFYLKDAVDAKNGSKLVLRTHTSNMQVRIMEGLEPPLRVIVPGRVFRNEATDATHDHTFFQLEGFVVDTDISIANLTQILTTVLSTLLEEDVEVRLRPGYFPYVEPGFEVDCYATFKDGRKGWMEMLGCGMIHPKVFEAAGYPAGKYTGFAFGLGLNRLAMLKYGISDGRDFIGGDMRFLKQF